MRACGVPQRKWESLAVYPVRATRSLVGKWVMKRSGSLRRERESRNIKRRQLSGEVSIGLTDPIPDLASSTRLQTISVRQDFVNGSTRIENWFTHRHNVGMER